MWLVDREPAHLCQLCNQRRFATASNLYRHMRTCRAGPGRQASLPSPVPPDSATEQSPDGTEDEDGISGAGGSGFRYNGSGTVPSTSSAMLGGDLASTSSSDSAYGQHSYSSPHHPQSRQLASSSSGPIMLPSRTPSYEYHPQQQQQLRHRHTSSDDVNANPDDLFERPLNPNSDPLAMNLGASSSAPVYPSQSPSQHQHPHQQGYYDTLPPLASTSAGVAISPSTSSPASMWSPGGSAGAMGMGMHGLGIGMSNAQTTSSQMRTSVGQEGAGSYYMPASSVPSHQQQQHSPFGQPQQTQYPGLGAYSSPHHHDSGSQQPYLPRLDTLGLTGPSTSSSLHSSHPHTPIHQAASYTTQPHPHYAEPPYTTPLYSPSTLDSASSSPTTATTASVSTPSTTPIYRNYPGHNTLAQYPGSAYGVNSTSPVQSYARAEAYVHPGQSAGAGPSTAQGQGGYGGAYQTASAYPYAPPSGSYSRSASGSGEWTMPSQNTEGGGQADDGPSTSSGYAGSSGSRSGSGGGMYPYDQGHGSSG